jgi:hypothetical protein
LSTGQRAGAATAQGAASVAVAVGVSAMPAGMSVRIDAAASVPVLGGVEIGRGRIDAAASAAVLGGVEIGRGDGLGDNRAGEGSIGCGGDGTRPWCNASGLNLKQCAL